MTVESQRIDVWLWLCVVWGRHTDSRDLRAAHRHINDAVETIELVSDDREVGELRDLGVKDVVIKLLQAEVKGVLLQEVLIVDVVAVQVDVAKAHVDKERYAEKCCREKENSTLHASEFDTHLGNRIPTSTMLNLH